jgi:hypothetical protein
MLWKITTPNSRFAKAGVSCFYDSKVLNSSIVHLMKFSAEKPRLRKAANRYCSFNNKSTFNDFIYTNYKFKTVKINP